MADSAYEKQVNWAIDRNLKTPAISANDLGAQSNWNDAHLECSDWFLRTLIFVSDLALAFSQIQIVLTAVALITASWTFTQLGLQNEEEC